MSAPEPARRNPGVRHEDPSSTATGRSGSNTLTGAGRRQKVMAGDVVLCGGAIDSPQTAAASRAWGTRAELERAGGRRGAGPARRRRALAGSPGGLRPARLHPAGLDVPGHANGDGGRWSVSVPASCGAGRCDERLLGRRLRSEQRSRRLSEPPCSTSCPSPSATTAKARLPMGTATRCMSGRCTPDARSIGKSNRRIRAIRALRFHSFSTVRTARMDPRRSTWRAHILNQPAFDPFNAGELSPGPTVPSDDQIMDWVARDAETALHPSCTCRWDGRAVGDRPAHDARARARGPARRRCLRDALRHERQHLRARDDGRREGRRSSSWRHPALPPGEPSTSTGTAPAANESRPPAPTLVWNGLAAQPEHQHPADHERDPGVLVLRGHEALVQVSGYDCDHRRSRAGNTRRWRQRDRD